jgi:polygalacturonase
MKKNILFVLLVLCCLTGLAQSNQTKTGKIYNIKDYGAVGDGQTLNTDAINKAISACIKDGGGTVFVPAEYTMH